MNPTLEPSLETLESQFPTPQSLVREISNEKAPPKLLVILMNLLEKMRQGRGMGWSRAWNKYGVNTFHTHKVLPTQDHEQIEEAHRFLSLIAEKAGKEHLPFIEDLLTDPNLMCFHFYHDRDEDLGPTEGLTVSLGRKVPDDRSKRDRIDIVFEDTVVAGAVDGLVDRIRVFICPWSEYQDGRAYHLIDFKETPGELREVVQDFYNRQVECFHRWKRIPERTWDHWSTRYIDYFGPRKISPLNTRFY